MILTNTTELANRQSIISLEQLVSTFAARMSSTVPKRRTSSSTAIQIAFAFWMTLDKEFTTWSLKKQRAANAYAAVLATHAHIWIFTNSTVQESESPDWIDQKDLHGLGFQLVSEELIYMQSYSEVRINIEMQSEKSNLDSELLQPSRENPPATEL